MNLRIVTKIPFRQAPISATVVALALAIGVPAVAGAGIPEGLAPIATATYATAALVGLRFSWLLFRGEQRLHEMVFCIFTYVFFGIAPLVQLQYGFPGTTQNVRLSFYTNAALAGLIGTACVFLGITISNLRRHDVRFATSIRVNARAVYWFTAVCFAAVTVYVAQVGFQTLFASRSTLNETVVAAIDDSVVRVALATFAKVGTIVAFVAQMVLRQQLKLEGKRMSIALPVVTFIVLFSIINPISTARIVFGTAALAAASALGAFATARRFRVNAVLGMVGMVVLFPILDTFRRTLDATIELKSPLESLVSGDFDAFAQLINTMEYIAVNGVTYGRQALGPLLFWLPRAVWEAKPIDTGIFLANFKGYSFTNLSASLWTEAFINFGWPGLIALMFGFGVLLQKLDGRVIQSLQLSRIPGVITSITPFYLFILLRGSLLQATLPLAIILIGGWFLNRNGRTAEGARYTDAPGLVPTQK